jgi:signal transduction histidine kinase
VCRSTFFVGTQYTFREWADWLPWCGKRNFYREIEDPLSALVKGGYMRKKYKILLTLSEEDPCSPVAIKSVLEDKGYHVTALGGSLATETLEKKDFDLVITDLLAVLQKAKELNPEIMAILVLTTRCKRVPTAQATRSTADSYLFKPFEWVELERRVAGCVEKLECRQATSQPKGQKPRFEEEIPDFLKIMSHDIRGSLVSISATLKLLSRGHYGKMDEDVANSIKKLFSKTVDLIQLTEEYLGKTVSVNGGLEMEEEMLDLVQDVIQPVLGELSPELNENNIRVDNLFSAVLSGQISIRASRAWLKTVYRNLLKNAVKYGGKGCKIALSFENRISSYRFSVYNSGSPVPEEYRAKLFSESTRGNLCTDGVGMGLYLIKKIIQKRGGDIWYEAKEDGSNFVFTFPAGISSSLAC